MPQRLEGSLCGRQAGEVAQKAGHGDKVRDAVAGQNAQESGPVKRCLLWEDDCCAT